MVKFSKYEINFNKHILDIITEHVQTVWNGAAVQVKLLNSFSTASLFLYISSASSALFFSVVTNAKYPIIFISFCISFIFFSYFFRYPCSSYAILDRGYFSGENIRKIVKSGYEVIMMVKVNQPVIKELITKHRLMIADQVETYIPEYEVKTANILSAGNHIQ